MYEAGYYWVKVAVFLSWHIAYYDGYIWKMLDDENYYTSIDFNIINPNKIKNPDEENK